MLSKHLFILLYYFLFRSEGVLKAFIGVDKKPIALSELAVVPTFFRFANIILDYSTGFQSIAQKCESFSGYLSSMKSTLYDSNRIDFRCEIDKEDPTQFTDYSALLEHIRQIVSICDSSRGYSFVVWDYDVGSEAFANLIVSILEMPEIARSSLVTMLPTFGIPTTLIELPVEAISNWLNQERHSMNQNQRQRHFNLSLFCPVHYAQIQKMCDFLKQVSFINVCRPVFREGRDWGIPPSTAGKMYFFAYKIGQNSKFFRASGVYRHR